MKKSKLIISSKYLVTRLIILLIGFIFSLLRHSMTLASSLKNAPNSNYETGRSAEFVTLAVQSRLIVSIIVINNKVFVV